MRCAYGRRSSGHGRRIQSVESSGVAWPVRLAMAWSAPISGDELLACIGRPRCWRWSLSSSLSSSSPSSLSSPAAATATATVTAGGWIRLPTRDREAEAEKQRRTVKRRREESSSSDTMNMVRHHLVPLALLLVAITLPQSALGADISVRIERHFPCSASSGYSAHFILSLFPFYSTVHVSHQLRPARL